MSAESLSLFDQYPILSYCRMVENQLQPVPGTKQILQLKNPLDEIDREYQSLVLIVTGAPGTGKDSVGEKILEQSSITITRPKTATTRKPRPHEKQNDPYTRMTEEEFLRNKEQGYFFESIEHFSDGQINYYGTPKSEIERLLSQGENIILRIDPTGAKAMHQMWVDQTFFQTSLLVHCHVTPPDYKQIIDRLYARAKSDGQITGDQIREQIKDRIPQITKDLAHMKDAHYVLINSDNALERLTEELVLLLKNFV